MKKHIIDCDKKPNIPFSGWTVESHKKQGKLAWDPSKIELYFSEKQKTGVILGNDLRKELEDKPVLNASVLDYLLKHQDLIPEEWKGKYVYFWGTIFRDALGGLFVGCLYWNGGTWNWNYNWLDNDWNEDGPAASLASMPSDGGKVGTSRTLDPLALRISELEKFREKVEKILKL
jgi:hypothetical protein